MNRLDNNKYAGLLQVLLMLLALIPVSLVAMNVNLKSEVGSAFGGFIALVTDSAGSRGFLITLAILCLATLALNLPRKVLLANVMVLVVLLLTGFASKTTLKVLTESPRPYTELLAKDLLIPEAAHFYNLDEEQQVQLIDSISSEVSPWRTSHWQGEKDYSFPSGHTIFAAICVVFFGGLFWKNQRYSWAIGVLLWASLVAYSRLWLGMHRPIDLIGSTLFISVVYAMLPNFNRLADVIYVRLPKQIRE
ncbi:phosphatase PAP2 family protein [Vibrio amylolyticus]|uniref:phosphatase PAP2 family protein n=1 Tax=Vibrio amylolyticus TaxID=2847292 RepID=UPI00354F978E